MPHPAEAGIDFILSSRSGGDLLVLTLEIVHLGHQYLWRCLVGVFEPPQTLNGLSTRINALVCAVELEVQGQSDDDDQGTREHTSQNTRVVCGFVLFTEHRGADDSANTSSTHKSRRAQSTLPLASNVVGLPGEYTRDIRIAGRGGEEDTEVANTDILDIAEQWQTLGVVCQQRKAWD